MDLARGPPHFAAMTRLVLVTLLACLAVCAVPSRAQAPAAFTVEESGAGFDALADAVAAIGGGSGTILIAPGRYRQCAVQEAGRIAFVARTAGSVLFDGVACEGKAALVLAGRSARVEGIVFQNIRVPDGNGAGIRLEAGDLVVRDSLFRNGENGILVANDHRGTVRIEQSTFSGLGYCPEDGGCAHGIYNSGDGSLTVSRTRFERGTGGHYLKARTPRVTILNSSFDDSQGQNTNYLIDLPNGAAGRIAGNTFVQGTGKENYSTLITVAPEGLEHPSTNLLIEDNTASLVPGFRWATAFVGNWTGGPVVMRNNRLAAGITPHQVH